MVGLVRKVSTGLGVLALLAVAGACGEDPVEVVEFEVIEEVTFGANLGVQLDSMEMLASGEYIQDRVVGTGALVEVGSALTVSYTGWLADGTEFDSGSLDFTVGDGQLIPGFDQGVRGMNVGGTRLVIIPPERGYGASARGLIPAGAVLVFEITVDSVN
jgi:FKBP-type peptidyl-prolyl cis-trans isomerase